MKSLSNYIGKRLNELTEKRKDLFFQSLPEEMKTKFYNALRLLNEFQDDVIINYLIKKK